jgi:hypothetical protein
MTLFGAKGVKTTIKTSIQECGNKSFKNSEVSVFYKYPDKTDSFVFYYDTSKVLFKYSSFSQTYNSNGEILTNTRYGYSNKDSLALDSLNYQYFTNYKIIKHYSLNLKMKIKSLDTIYLNKDGLDSLITFTFFGSNIGVDSPLRNGIQYYYSGKNLDSSYRIFIYRLSGKNINSSYLWTKNINYLDSQTHINYTSNHKIWLIEKNIKVSNLITTHSRYDFTNNSNYIDSTILNKDSTLLKYSFCFYDESYGKFLPFTTFKYFYKSNKQLTRVFRYDFTGLAYATPTCPTISVQTYTYDSVNYITSMVSSSKEENKLSIYPNPVGVDRIVYFANSTNSGIVQVYGLDGKLIYSTSIKSSNKVELPLEIPKGLYLMRVQDNTGWSGYSKVMVE